jgi:hypothetical protein
MEEFDQGGEDAFGNEVPNVDHLFKRVGQASPEEFDLDPDDEPLELRLVIC